MPCLPADCHSVEFTINKFDITRIGYIYIYIACGMSTQLEKGGRGSSLGGGYILVRANF